LLRSCWTVGEGRYSLLIKFEQAGEIPPVQRPPDFVKWGLYYILQLGYATSCTAPSLAPARARARVLREPGSNRGVGTGAFSPRAPARLRLRRTPVAVACRVKFFYCIYA
jgi:hypothetical protein